jgi:hypothetical protein
LTLKFNPEIALHFLNIKKKLLLFVGRVGMWETPSVFHIPTRFSFFASFFLFVEPPAFVKNLVPHWGYRIAIGAV